MQIIVEITIKTARLDGTSIDEVVVVADDYFEVAEPETTTEPTAQDDTDSMLVDHEYRITLLELGLGVTE